MGTSSSGVVGLVAAVFTLAAAFLFVFPAAGLVAAADFALGFLGPAFFLDVGYFRLRGCLCNRLRSGFRICWSGGGLVNTPPSDDVIPALAQIRLLGRGPLRNGGLACGGALPDTF